jgi:hypothetical protein
MGNSIGALRFHLLAAMSAFVVGTAIESIKFSSNGSQEERKPYYISFSDGESDFK